jgi:hypothetical protein
LPLPEAVAVRGISKSAVSERFVYCTERRLMAPTSRGLHGFPLAALMIDINGSPHEVRLPGKR